MNNVSPKKKKFRLNEYCHSDITWDTIFCIDHILCGGPTDRRCIRDFVLDPETNCVTS